MSANVTSVVRTTATQPRRRKRSSAWLPPVAIVGLFVVWEIAVRVFGIPPYLLPPPSKVFDTMWTERATLIEHCLTTLAESLGGFAVGNVIAIVLAIIFVEYQAIKQTVYPIAVALRTVPIIAIVPILTLLLGNEWQPKVAIAALITFFPTLVDMIKGLTSVPREVLELCHVLDANRWYVLWRVRLPASAPHLFAALKIAATSSVLGAVVAEWIGSQKGVGYIIVLATYQFRGDLLYAGILLASAMTLALFGLVGLAESLVIRWERRPELGDQ